MLYGYKKVLMALRKDFFYGSTYPKRISESLTRTNGALSDISNSIHPRCFPLVYSMPMDRCALAQHFVVEMNANLRLKSSAIYYSPLNQTQYAQ